MIKTIQEIICDVCEVELYDNEIRINCGKFEEPFINRDDGIHLCYSCAGKIFALNYNKDIKTNDLKQNITNLRGVTGKFKQVELDWNCFKGVTNE